MEVLLKTNKQGRWKFLFRLSFQIITKNKPREDALSSFSNKDSVIDGPLI